MEESRIPLEPEIFFDLGVVFPDGRHEIFSLNRELMAVGYEDDCDVVVPKGRYFRPQSAESFRLERRGAEVIFHSDKPVLVNGVAVRNTRLKAGDRIVFGSYRFAYDGLREVEPARSEPPAPKFAYLGLPMAAGLALGGVFMAPVSVSLPVFPQPERMGTPSDSQLPQLPELPLRVDSVSIPENLAEWRTLDQIGENEESLAEVAEPIREPEPKSTATSRYETRKLGVMMVPERSVSIPGRYTEWRIADGRTYPRPPEAVATVATPIDSVQVDDLQGLPADTASDERGGTGTSSDSGAEVVTPTVAAEPVSAETMQEAVVHESSDVSIFELEQFVRRPPLSRYVAEGTTPLRMISPGDSPGNGEVDILCIHAHPDDEAIDFGALIAAASRKGLRVAVVLFTDGESGLDIYPERYIDPEYPNREMSGSELARVRVEETRRSLTVLGADAYVRLGLANNPYNGIADELTVDAVADMWGGKEYLVALLRDLMRRFRPEIVVSPDGPSAALEHFEHETVGRLVTATLQQMRAEGDPYSPRAHLVSVDPAQSWAYPDTVGLDRNRQALRGPFSFVQIQSAALEQHISQRDASVIGIRKVSTFDRELYEIRRWELPVPFSVYFLGDTTDDSGEEEPSGALVDSGGE